MRLPRDLSGTRLAALLGRFGYAITRQTGSHIRLTTTQPSEHHLTVPNHDPVKIGTLNSILRDVSLHAGVSREDVLSRLME